jgi:hypothetical protein
MTARPSLKALAGATQTPDRDERPAPSPTAAIRSEPLPRLAQTRLNSRQVSGHFKPEVAHALRLLAAEQDREQQEMLAEALNMLFERYGKPTRAEVLGTRRKRP